MELISLVALLAAPVLWFVLLILPSAFSNARPALIGICSELASLLALGAGLSSAAGLLLRGGQPVLLPGGLFFVDALSAIMASLIGFIGWVIVRYSRTYLAGDRRQGEFMQWLGGTLAAVFLLVIAGNLALLIAAWIATSLCLHPLLAFYSDRAAAVMSARKKLIFSRAADGCLVLAAILLYREFQTLDLPAMFEQARVIADVNGSLTVAALFLAMGAILKSAQFPFHTWLPDTLETPTPVSALMHAGIISAGGFLLIRMSPVVGLAPNVLLVLAVVGAVTAIFGSLVMLTQTSIKKSLAFSTVAQMGYMILQCGLGAFSLAALHLVAHSLYKAHAFLSSGGTVARTPPPALSGGDALSVGSGWVAKLAAALAFGVLLSVGIGWGFGISLTREPGLIVLGAVLVMAVTTLLWSAVATKKAVLLRTCGLAVCVCVAYFTLHSLSALVLSGVVPASAAPTGFLGGVVMILIVSSFFLVFLLQASLAKCWSAPWCQRLYVLIFNRFYVNTFVNRVLLKFWPLAKA